MENGNLENGKKNFPLGSFWVVFRVGSGPIFSIRAQGWVRIALAGSLQHNK
jgi:hypothetical protein